MCPAEEFGETVVKWRCYEDVVVGINERTGKKTGFSRGR